MKVLFLNILFLAAFGCKIQKKENLIASDIRLFRSVAWELAKAVESEDTTRIKKILDLKKVDVNIREPKFGMTLLIWSVRQNRYNSTNILLNYGADPNMHDTDDGLSAIIAAADKLETSNFLRLILNNGGDPNNCIDTNIISFRPTPLIAASRNRLESVKMLIEAGANVNYSIRFESALSASLRNDKEDIVRYLLFDIGANFETPLMKTIDGEYLYITHYLRKWTFPLNSDRYKVKMDIVNFLKENGMNYWNEIIPNNYYNLYSAEYLEKY